MKKDDERIQIGELVCAVGAGQCSGRLRRNKQRIQVNKAEG